MTTTTYQLQLAATKDYFSKKLFNAKHSLSHTPNLSKGIEVAVYPLNEDSPMQCETMTVYNYPELKALKDLVTLGGDMGKCEVQYLDSAYTLWDEAIHNVDYFIKLCTKFYEVPVEVVCWILNNFPDEDDLIDILTGIVEDEEEVRWSVFEVEDELQAFFEWIDCGYEAIDIPDDLRAYFDYEKYMTDRVKHGTLNIKQLAPRKFLVIDMGSY